MKKLLLLMTTALLLQMLPVSVTNSATAAGTASQPVAAVSGHSVMPATPGSIASLRVREIVKTLHMTAHPEGGWFTEVYTAPDNLQVHGRYTTTSRKYLLPIKWKRYFSFSSAGLR
jgi:hypothetical protein